MSDEKLRNLVDVKTISKVLNVPVGWVYERTSKGQSEIRFYKIGKYLRFDVEEVLKFFEEQRNKEE